MNDRQKRLVDYLKNQRQIYATERKLYLSPQERAKRVAFFDESIEEVKRLVEKELQSPTSDGEFPMGWGGGALMPETEK